MRANISLIEINLLNKTHLIDTQYRKLLIKNLKYMPKCLVLQNKMVAVAQLVRVLVCGAEGRGFEPHQPPILERSQCLKLRPFFYLHK